MLSEITIQFARSFFTVIIWKEIRREGLEDTADVVENNFAQLLEIEEKSSLNADRIARR